MDAASISAALWYVDVCCHLAGKWYDAVTDTSGLRLVRL